MGNTYRMIAIDLDGTLLCPQGQVSARVKKAIHRALQSGLLVCFATGRNWTESRQILREVEHHDTAVFVGGAMVIDTKRSVTLQRTIMQPELAAEVCDALENIRHAVLALQDTSVAGVDYLITAGVEMNDATHRWIEKTTTTVKRIEKLGRHKHEHTVRCGVCAPSSEIAEAKVMLNRRFGSRILCQSLYVPATSVEVVEVFDPAVNKWRGILHVAARHGVSPEQIIAIGDDVNDLPMIRNAGLGVAMGNARPEVLAAAKLTIGRNDEEGLAKFLEELVARQMVEPIAPGKESAA
jgi:5-amino-6-(5-phospho-D-ribitylamino)uracil phosphatase